jgi:amino acid transporter
VVPNYHLWQEGFFQNIADKVAPWLGVMMTVAAAVSNFGMANALIATLARTCWAMALEEGTISPHTTHTTQTHSLLGSR